MSTGSVMSLKGLDPLSGSLNVGKTTGSRLIEDIGTGLLDTGEQNGKITTTFDTLLSSAMDMIKETNQYSNEAAEAEMAYALGITNSTHDLQVAQMKAGISLQYTVAVRNAVMDAYKEIMTMQF